MRIVYGINPVREAVAAERGGRGSIEKILLAEGRGGAAREIISAAGAAGIRVEKVPAEELKKLTGTPKHQGVVAILSGGFSYRTIEDLIKGWKKSGEPAFFLILDSVQDPRNLGSLIRTAYAAGVHGVVIPRDRSAEVTPTVVKASAGATEHAPIARETNIVRVVNILKENNVWVAAVEADAPETIYTTDLTGDIAVVIGSEGAGIRRLVRESCDFSVSIPMARKFNSLNAAQAGAVTLFEVRRQRLAEG